MYAKQRAPGIGTGWKRIASRIVFLEIFCRGPASYSENKLEMTLSRKLMKFIRHILVLLMALSSPLYAGAFPPPSELDNVEELFQANNPFELTLETDFEAFAENIEKEEYLPARIYYSLGNGTKVEQGVEVKARGQYRRRRCELPPIRINFKGKKYRVDLFNNLGKIKLVNSCTPDSSSQEYLVKEYLAYKIYETLTDFSLKTWFLKIKFVDNRGNYDPFTSMAFLVEDIDDLAIRHDGEEIETEELDHDQLDAQAENLLGLFQFMIGNTDWFVSSLHNIKLIKLNDPDVPDPIPVPYDFDFSGLVNAPYARPHTDLFPIESVRERHFLGECRSHKIYRETFEIFQEKKDSIYVLVRECKFLDEVARKDALSYMDGFYEVLDSKQLTRKEIYRGCYR
jgi:hypothetical protein